MPMQSFAPPMKNYVEKKKDGNEKEMTLDSLPLPGGVLIMMKIEEFSSYLTR